MGLSHAQTRHRCDRIREWVSLELDCDLSRIERALVDRHLAGCAECRAFAIDVHAFTDRLRAAPLEPLEQPIQLPGRGRLTARSFQVAVAASVAVAAIGVASLSSSLRGDSLGAKVTPVSAEPSKDQMRQRQLQQLTDRISQTLPRPVGNQPV
jgi:predicted anti-sigma-YlaC factor YlaD